MPIKQEEMKAIADAATHLRDLYLGDFTQLGVLRTMYAESGQQVHLEAMLETLDRMVWSAAGATAQYMLPVERYLERYRLTASANAANAERKRRARARVANAGATAHRAAVQHALDILDATTQGALRDDEWAALQEYNARAPTRTRSIDAPDFAEALPPAPGALPPAPGMADLPDIHDEEDE